MIYFRLIWTTCPSSSSLHNFLLLQINLQGCCYWFFCQFPFSHEHILGAIILCWYQCVPNFLIFLYEAQCLSLDKNQTPRFLFKLSCQFDVCHRYIFSGVQFTWYHFVLNFLISLLQIKIQDCLWKFFSECDVCHRFIFSVISSHPYKFVPKFFISFHKSWTPFVNTNQTPRLFEQIWLSR